MTIHWLEQTESDLPAANQWLSASETACLQRMLFLKRRSDWRLGRWTAKKAVAAFLNLAADLAALANIEIHAGPSGAPDVFLRGQPAPAAISLSHRDGVGLCAVAAQEPIFGCDLEIVETRSPAFAADYFTPAERTLVEGTGLEKQAQVATLLWSAKESTLKALRVGLRSDTRDVSVDPQNANAPRKWHDPISLAQPDSHFWYPLDVSHTGAQAFHGWWRVEGRLARTIVCADL